MPKLPALIFLMLAFAAARADDAPAAAKPGAYGLLWLDVSPGPAAVVLDGAFLDSGVWLISVPPGAHALRVSKPGFRDWESRFSISPGQSLHLDAVLEPRPGGPGDS